MSLNRGFRLTWLGHHTFRLETSSGRIVLIDPWVEGNPACPQEHKSFEKLDVITISHGHGDHMGDAVTLAKKLKPVVISNVEIHAFLKKQGVTNTSPMNKGGTQQVQGLIRTKCRGRIRAARRHCDRDEHAKGEGAPARGLTG